MSDNAGKLLRMLAGVRRSRTKRFTLTVLDEMANRLEEERKKRFLDSVPETIRMILSEYLLGCNRKACSTLVDSFDERSAFKNGYHSSELRLPTGVSAKT